MHPKVTVIIVSWNAREMLAKCLPSVVGSTYPNLEIVLADNATTDETVEWLEARFPSVRTLIYPENWGFCKGNNRAMSATTGPYLVLLNNDVEVEPGWLEPLVERAESDAAIAAIQPKLRSFDRRDFFEYAGGSGGHVDRLGYPFVRGRIFSELEKDRGQYEDAVDVFWATGAAMFLRRSALDEVGLLDESFEFHMEEIDLCWRFWAAGYRVMVEPKSCVYHVGGGSLDQDDPRKTRYNFRNSLLMLYKNLPARRWRQVFPARMVLDSLAVLKFIGGGRFRQAIAVIAAYREALKMKRSYTRGPDDFVPPSYRRSIVADFWLRRRRKYSDLDATDFRLPTATE